MSDEPDNHEASGTRRPPPPPVARPGVAPPAKPAVPRLPPPPAFVPPKRPSVPVVGVGASAPAPPSAPSPRAPSSSAPRAPARTPVPLPGSPPGARAPTASTAPGPARSPSPAVAAPIAASRASRAAQPARSSEKAPSGIDLPPPPEFLPIGLEEDDPSDRLASITLPGIPLVPRDSDGRSVVEALDDVERDASGRSVVETLDDLRGSPTRAARLRDTGRRTPVSAPHAIVRDDEHAPPARTSDDTSASDEVDIDLDASEDTLPRLAPAGLGKEPYPSLPPSPAPVPAAPSPVSAAPSQVPTAPVPVVGTAASAAPRARTGRFADLVPTPRRRPLALWIGVGAGVGIVISIVALLWLSTSQPEKEAAREPAAEAGTATPATKATTEPAPPRAPEAKATPVAPPVPEAKADEPTPDEPTPTITTAPADDDASVITVARDDSDYRRAAADYRATGSQKSLLAMATAACALGNGPKARAAFRKLVGKALRSEAMAACRDSKVDVTSTVEGYTGPELLAQARAALADGDARTAFDKAHASNKVERSSEAVLVKGLAACKLGDGEQAQRLLPHVAVKSRPRLHEGCREAGVALRE